MLLITDLFHLDHYGSSAHFPGHAIVLAGYDAESAYVSDTAFEGLQRTSLGGLERARHEQHPFYPLAGHMVDLPGAAPTVEDLIAAAGPAIERAAGLMLEPELGEFEGMAALERFAAEVGDWPSDASDWQWCARFSYQVIERRGTGGGNFRRLYARFLAEVGRPEAELAEAAAEHWSELAAAMYEASESAEPDAEAWARIATVAGTIVAAERRLWDALAA